MLDDIAWAVTQGIVMPTYCPAVCVIVYCYPIYTDLDPYLLVYMLQFFNCCFEGWEREESTENRVLAISSLAIRDSAHLYVFIYVLREF